MFRDPFVLVPATDHEPGDVLQEEQRRAALGAELDEMRTLERGLGEQNAVVGHNADRMAHHPRKTTDERTPVRRFELVQTRSIHNPGDDLTYVERLARRLRHDAVDLVGVVERRLNLIGRRHGPVACRLAAQVGYCSADHLQRVLVVLSQVIGDSGDLRVYQPAAQLFCRDLLAGRGPHQRRTAEEDRAHAVDDDRLVGHRRHIRAAGRTGAHHGRNLGNARRRHRGLVEEDPPEVVAVGEDIRLHRKECASGVHEVDAGQPILRSDLLGAQMLLDRDRVVAAALHRRVIGHDHDLASRHAPNAGDDPGARRFVVVHPVCC